MEAYQRGNLTKVVAATVLTALFSAMTAAQYGGSGTFGGFLNMYFLPGGAQISGISGLLFGVLIPFMIVAILLVVGLQSVDIFNQRQSTVLGVLIALFIIPSGGYKVISESLMALFGLGRTGISTPGFTGTPLDPIIQSPVWMGILAYFVSVYVLNKVVTDAETGFKPMEHIAAGTIAILVWAGLTGEQNLLILAVFWGFILFFGWKMFKRGTGMGGGSGFLIALFGIFLLGIGISRMEVLPEQIQAIGSAITGYIQASFWIVLILTVVAVGIFLAGKYNGWW